VSSGKYEVNGILFCIAGIAVAVVMILCNEKAQVNESWRKEYVS
jgi:hypothetical protein